MDDINEELKVLKDRKVKLEQQMSSLRSQMQGIQASLGAIGKEHIGVCHSIETLKRILEK